MRARLVEVQLAVMLLTRLPAGRIEGTAPDLIFARWAFPLVGAGVGLIGWAVCAGALALGAVPLLASLLTIGALAMVTGALHFDGLADFADGIGGGRDKAHCLEIMRDSRIGSYGVLAMVLVTALWAVALSEVAKGLGPFWFMAMGALSRGAMVGLQEWLPPARSDGMGKLAAGRSQMARFALGVAGIAVLTTGNAGLVVVVAMSGIALVTGHKAKARIGGQTGDVLGAAQLLSETAGWIALSLVL